jgi:hypothetical protein
VLFTPNKANNQSSNRFCGSQFKGSTVRYDYHGRVELNVRALPDRSQKSAIPDPFVSCD